MAKRHLPGDVLIYIGHTDNCTEECGWPCCPPGQGCPWQERVGKKLTVLDICSDGVLKVSFEGEPGSYFIRFLGHVSEDRRIR